MIALNELYQDLINLKLISQIGSNLTQWCEFVNWEYLAESASLSGTPTVVGPPQFQ